MDSRRPSSRSPSGSSKSVSRSPRPVGKRRVSRSASLSPPRRVRRSRSPPRRGRSPNFIRRSRSPPRRGWSPTNTRSPRRRRRSYSRSPRGRSPVAAARSPSRRRRSPQLSYSPRGRSPNVRSPRRRRSPVYMRSSPRRRKSPPLSPRYRRRSPRYAYSPVRRNTSPPARRRHTAVSPQRHVDSSPRRRPRFSSPRHGSPSPRRVTRSFSPAAFSKSPQRRESSGSPQRHSSASPRPSLRNSSRSRRNTSSIASPQQSKGRLSKVPVSPVQQHKLPAYQQHSSRSPSPVVLPAKPSMTVAESPSHGIRHEATLHRRRLSPSVSPQIQQRSPSLSKASPPKEIRRSSPASGRSFLRERPVKTEQRNLKTFEHISTTTNTLPKKRTRASSRESSLPDEDREGAPLMKSSISDVNAGVPSTLNRQAGKGNEDLGSLSKSSDDDQHPSSGGKWRISKEMESDGNADPGASLAGMDDRKAVKRRRKEERRLRKEEKRRKREERHRRKEEKRANKFLSKGIASVTPPPDFDKRTMRSDGLDTADEGKYADEDMEIEQIKLENELRKKALDSIRAKKVVSS